MLLAEGINLYNIGRDFHWKWNCIVTLKKISAYVAQQLIPDPVCKGIVGNQPTASLDLGSVIMRKISAMRPAYISRQVLLITSRKQPGNELI